MSRKIHIHTKNPGLILDYAIKHGTLHEVQIHNMLAQKEAAAHQAKEESVNQDEQSITDCSPEEPKEGIVAAEEAQFKDYGIVAVSMGEGIGEIFSSLGVDQVVYGGQTMNPSTSDLAQAATKVPARTVFSLPNNGNIFMAASQVNEIVEGPKVYVIPQSLSHKRLQHFLPLIRTVFLRKRPGDVRSLISRSFREVTYAVRSSQYGDLEISEGDILGLVEDKITTTGRDILESQRSSGIHELAGKRSWTIFYGKDMRRRCTNA
jgi:dihydroxyacetone kinase-like predicted kinase